MGLFGKKGKSRDEVIAEAAELNSNEGAEEKKEEDFSSGNQKIDIELTKIKGRLDGMEEVRKASSERFSRVSEQIGELRGMIVDTNKAMSKVEVSATKAVDLVESVHPEKLMIEVRKQDGKIESLRAAIESNDAIMKDLMLELKKMRDKMNFYKGIEQVIQLNEEIKQELATIKKVEATIERHADKVETIFVEVEKKFSDFDKFNDVTKDLDKSFKRLTSDFEKIRTKTEMKLERKEFVDMMDRFNEFEKHTTNLLKLLDERNKTVKDELHANFRMLVKQYQKRLDAMNPRPITEIEEEIRKKVEEEVNPEASGEDSAGSDAKPGLMSKVKGMFKKSEEEPEEETEEIFEENAEKAPSENEQETAEELKKIEEAKKQKDEASEKPVKPDDNQENSEEIETPENPDDNQAGEPDADKKAEPAEKPAEPAEPAGKGETPQEESPDDKKSESTEEEKPAETAEEKSEASEEKTPEEKK